MAEVDALVLAVAKLEEWSMSLVSSSAETRRFL